MDSGSSSLSTSSSTSSSSSRKSKKRGVESQEHTKKRNKENQAHASCFVQMIKEAFPDSKIDKNTIFDFLFNLAGYEYDKSMYMITKTPYGPGKIN